MYGNNNRLSQSYDNKQIRNTKYNIISIQNNKKNVNENYLHQNSTYYLKDSNNNQINRKRGESSEKNITKRRNSEKKVNNCYKLYDNENYKQKISSSETKFILDANKKPDRNGKWDNMPINNYENYEITKYLLDKRNNYNNKYNDFSKENNKNTFLNENGNKKTKFRLRNNTADQKIENRKNLNTANGSNIGMENLGTMHLLNEGMKNRTMQTKIVQ